jgi:hypothetical protein
MEKISERLSWIRELVKAEEQMEDTGMVDMSTGLDPRKRLQQETLKMLQELKNQFIDSATAFNELKTSALGRIKIYGIAKTVSDFMLFRNGYKMIFSLKEPGLISIRFNFIGPQYIPSQIPTASSSATQAMMEEILLEAKMGAFGELQWTYQGHLVKTENIVKYNMTMFVKESTK